MAHLHDLTALEAAAAIRAREIGSRELVDHYLDRIERLDPQVGAFVTVVADSARSQADEADALTLSGADLPPLHGVPTAIKDLNSTAGVPTSFGSTTTLGFVPVFDDFVVTALREAGTISLGKTATPEFGLPCYTETDIGPPARTPWDVTRSAGGSSGGAGAAVAAGLLPIAQGSDGGGSIRIPASACGLVGLKPARGRISRGPLDGDPVGLSVLGPLARTVRDAAAFLDATAGPRPGDGQWAPPLPDGQTFLDWCDRTPGSLRIGRYLDSPIDTTVDPQVADAWERMSRLLASLGHEIVDVDPPLSRDAVPLFELVWAVSAASAPVAPADEERLRPLTRHLRERGRAVTGAQYVQAVNTLAVLSRQGIAASAHLDAVLTPTLAQLPRPVGYFTDGGDPAEDFERQKRFTPWTSIYNMSGQPAISLPAYLSDPGHPSAAADGQTVPLPIGMMLVGRQAGEAPLLALAAQVEAAAPWRDRHPPVWTR